MTLTDLQAALASLDREEKQQAVEFLNAELGNESSGQEAQQSLPKELIDRSDQAYAYYVSELKPLLEPAHNGEYVAIDSKSQSYEVAKSLGRAIRALRTKLPDGDIDVIKIGPADFALSSRMRGERSR